jgi:choline dehydrogenase-like flavoprotein
MSNNFDIIIIGSGAGGGTLALKLAASGKRILILERGGYLPPEKAKWDTTEVFVKNRYVSNDTWCDKDDKAFQPGVHYFVGGATEMFGAALFRLRERDFIGHSSADGMTAAWPALPQNRITLNARNEIRFHYEFTNLGPINRLRSKLQGMLEHMDMHPHLIPNNVYMGKHIPLTGVAHQAGTCRFGSDPKSSVLDVNCKAHELDNLYVVDTSFFPSIGAVNPSLTAIADSLRVGEHLLERLR